MNNTTYFITRTVITVANTMAETDSDFNTIKPYVIGAIVVLMLSMAGYAFADKINVIISNRNRDNYELTSFPSHVLRDSRQQHNGQSLYPDNIENIGQPMDNVEADIGEHLTDLESQIDFTDIDSPISDNNDIRPDSTVRGIEEFDLGESNVANIFDPFL